MSSKKQDSTNLTNYKQNVTVFSSPDNEYVTEKEISYSLSSNFRRITNQVNNG